jgi:hypothetical protein
MNKLILSLCLSILIVGCGGGESGGSHADNTQIVISNTENGTPGNTVDTIPLRYMTELNVPNDFSYDPVVTRSFVIDISSYSTDRAHASVYSQFNEQSDGSYLADYTSRVASSALINGAVSLDFVLTQSEPQILVEIWFYDGSEPLQQVFSIDQQQWVW